MGRLWRFLKRLFGLGRKRHRSVFEQVVAPANMAAALARVQRRARENGLSEAELARFIAAGRDKLESLRQDLIRGRYRPGGVRRFSIAKPDGGKRGLTMLTLADRIAQTAANQVLTPLLDAEFSEASFGYRPNRSLADALDRVKALRGRGHTFVLDADIERCFDRIRHDRVVDRLRESVADRRLIRLIESWLAAFADGARGLPQGAPLSPLLCNVALDPLDQGFARGPGVLVRFSDDFLILCRSRREAEDARRRAAELLNRQGLRFNAQKTRVTTFADGFFFLGHYFVHDLMLRDATVDACEDVKRRAERQAERKQRRGFFGLFGRRA
ncbi:MAG: reverse transcriptase domain-containing protein [Defluviicoccus sp.]|nr:reverse transcriptase domain-containing protein [Defluviicoccus sp.]MDG4610285.1 reverse transcriptase domain-containing protein [Defluviicoccus sp.]